MAASGNRMTCIAPAIAGRVSAAFAVRLDVQKADCQTCQRAAR
jgi:hypothetical protein